MCPLRTTVKFQSTHPRWLRLFANTCIIETDEGVVLFDVGRINDLPGKK
jgi:hypothetical protein